MATRPPKSNLLDILQEESDRRTEAEFLAWWNEQEEKAKAETQAAIDAVQRLEASSSGGSSRGKPRRGGRVNSGRTSGSSMSTSAININQAKQRP